MSTFNPSFGEIRKRLLIPSLDIHEIQIRAFRAVDDPISSKAFAKGHLDVLNNFGLNLSSAKEGWISKPSVYVVIIESPDRQVVYGGARVEIFQDNWRLPIEAAVGEEAPEISNFLKSRTSGKIGELCGLWNSLAVAGLGIGSVYSIRCAIAVAAFIGLDELVALCSPYTYRIAHQYGFKLLQEVGNKGAIPYAGANEIAHVTHQSNIHQLDGADLSVKEMIQTLRQNPNQIRTENGREEKIEVHYQLGFSST
ncbi:MAG: hypothetical protein ACK5XV_00300 [Flavobacteriales bacterium]